MNDKRKEYLKKWREDNKEHIKNYKKEYAKTHDSSFKKLQDKYKQLQQENKILKEKYLNAVADYETAMSENELKKQLEEINIFIESCGFVNIEQLAFNYISLRQQIENDSKINVAYNKYAIECENKANVLETHQKEFIKYLEDKIEVVENKIFKLPIASYERNYLVNVGNDLIEILQKSKEIIGDDK